MKDLFALFRINQWLKNLIIFVPLFFSMELFDADYFLITFQAFVALGLISSSVYIFNDLIDADRDKLHPSKKNRPIASGRVNKGVALVLDALLAVTAVVYSMLILQSEYFTVFIVSYFFLMISYTLVWKHITIVDTIVIALGFVLRIFAGAILLQLSISSMLVITIISAALLISFGKRRVEVTRNTYDEAIKHRPALEGLPIIVLDTIISGLFAATFIAYILFCYGFRVDGLSPLLVEYLPPKLQSPNWLLLTVPAVFYTLARYLVVIYQRVDYIDKPEDIWFRDKSLAFSIVFVGAMLFVLIYFEQIYNF